MIVALLAGLVGAGALAWLVLRPRATEHVDPAEAVAPVVPAATSPGERARATRQPSQREAPVRAIADANVPRNAEGVPRQTINGGFEAGNLANWTRSGSAMVVDGGHSGDHSARLGSQSPFKGSSSIVQKVEIPASGKSTLSFWYMASDCAGGFGRKQAYVLDSQGHRVATALDACGPAETWTEASVDVTRWAGSVVTLQFIARDDGTKVSEFRLDDIALTTVGGK